MVKEPPVSVTSEKLPLTRKQIMAMATFACGSFCLGAMYSILAPFFPREVEKKGVPPSQYGIVFGIFQLGQFVFAPVMGKIIPTVSAKFFLVTGLFITAYCNILFGLLQWSPPGTTFFTLAFILRLVTSFGGSSFLTSSFTLIATDFKERTSTTFALTEMCFGVGMILGPSLGGVFYEIGGFSLPFFVTSCFTLTAATMAYFTLETKVTKRNVSEPGSDKDKVTLFMLLSTFSVSINVLINFISFVNIGFVDATLEHHIRDFTSLSPSQVGLIFMVSGLVYAISSQVFGVIMDKVDCAHAFCVMGYLLSLTGFLLSGPMYPIPLLPSITLIIISQVCLGISFGSVIVASFSEGLKQIRKSGFPDDIRTTSQVSALVQASLALGAAIGPMLGGYLIDAIGYEKAMIPMVLTQLFMIILIVSYQVSTRCIKKGC